ncbi:MAG: glycoside hydrolase family 27 protein [Acutalibacteraceae bacterium]
MTVNTPPMGWNSWNTFGKDISDKLIRETADIMVSSGLLEHGYNYLVIDDCWSLRERDENGKLVADPEKFPHGMKALADYVHSKGLKFGMYSCAGMITCAGYPASYGHEYDDAQTFAEWGVDFLKYDYCFKPESVKGEALYRTMGAALNNCGRDILFSACSWGADETRKWIGTTGANMWRATGDIYDAWKSVLTIAGLVPQEMPYTAKNCFFDLDMLIVGMYGNGNVGCTGCTDTEYKTHYSLWALLGSPLMIGCDIRNMNDATKRILMNKDVIAINQDLACNMPYNINARCNSEGFCEFPVYVKQLDNGDFAIGMFNFSEEKSNKWNCAVQLDMLGVSETTGKTLQMKELWTGEESVVKNSVFVSEIEPHDCRLYRARVIDK